MQDPMNRHERTTVDGFGGAYSSATAFGAIDRSADRSTFITLTYLHLFGAILAFVGIEYMLFASGAAEVVMNLAIRTNWLVFLGAFVLTAWGATHLAANTTSLIGQYAGLGIYVVAESLIFVPLLYIANRVAPGTISSAAACTLIGFSGLTLVAFGTRKDFSFLRGALMWGGICAFVAIIGGAIFGYTLGTFFSVAMVALAGASILYDTSNIISHYPANRYVGAALALFASVAMMFWYVLRILMQARR